MIAERNSPTPVPFQHRGLICFKRYVLAKFPVLPAAVLGIAALSYPVLAVPGSTRIDLFPRVKAGEILTYQVAIRASKRTKTKSSVTLAQTPGDINSNVRTLLRVEILGVTENGNRSSINARASFTRLDPETSKVMPPSGNSTDSDSRPIDFSILPDGHIDQSSGPDAIAPDQQQAWQQWTSRFAAAAVFPRSGIKPTQKWKSDEAERSPSPIGGLSWLRDSTYVRNEPCRPLRIDSQGNFVNSEKPADTCAVILTDAQLKQRSSSKDATPEDFRVRELRTSGTARGSNKTVLYISLRTGIVVRSSDEADQSMSVTIAKTDGSNQVHYDITAKSSSEIFLVSTN